MFVLHRRCLSLTFEQPWMFIVVDGSDGKHDKKNNKKNKNNNKNKNEKKNKNKDKDENNTSTTTPPNNRQQ